MNEVMLYRIDELIIVLYAMSLVFYFIDYLNKDQRAHKAAFIIHMTAYSLQTFSLVQTIVDMQRLPILSLFEGIYLYAWLLMTVSIFMHLFVKMNFFIFFLNAIGFVFITIHTFAPSTIEQSPLVETLISELLILHITFAFLSYVAFAMAFVGASLYFLLYRNLKRKKWTKQFGRLPSLNETLRIMKMGILIGLPFLFISLILGIQWAYVALSDWSIFDIKIIGSFSILVFYSIGLILFEKGKLDGNSVIWFNMLAFLVVFINFFLGSHLSNFHYWI